MRFLAATLALLTAFEHGASTTRPQAGASPRVTGAFLALSVPDLAASSEWYADKLGLTIALDIPPGATPGARVLRGDGLTVELIQHPEGRPRPAGTVENPVLLHGIVKGGFAVADLEGLLAQLRERKVDIAYGPFPASAQAPANVIVRDHDGNLIQIFGP